MDKLDKLIELNSLEKQNRRKSLEDKLRQQEVYGEIEELLDPVIKILNTNGKTGQAHSEAWQAHNETMQALENKTLAALGSNTNASKSLGHQH